MARLRRNNNSLNENAYMTMPSDNTRVASPYRVEQQIKSTQQRTPINLRETVLRLRREQDEQEERERNAARQEADRRQREREDEDRRKRNEEYYQKKEQEKQAQYEAEKRQMKNMLLTKIN